MVDLFLTVINMSLTASYAILIVIIIRLLMKKAPKSISYALWSVVAFRLLFPFSFESMFSLIPRNVSKAPLLRDILYQQSPMTIRKLALIDGSSTPLQSYIRIGAYIWILGIITLLAYSLMSILKLKRQLKGARLIDKNIYEAKNLNTPFVLGLTRPKIYLPISLNDTERSYILLHEQIHIRRKDHIIKIFAFIILSMHWFNPLVWMAFILMGNDMELSCDESVLKETRDDIKKPYANSLLSLVSDGHFLNTTSPAFGEGNIKNRIKNVLDYKKPRLWLVVTGIVIVVVTSLGLLFNPLSAGSRIDKSKVVRVALQSFPNGQFAELDNGISSSIIDQINRAKWSELKQKDWPDEDDIAFSIIITLQRDISVDNKEYILWIYRNKSKTSLGQDHAYALALTYNDLSGDIHIWSLPSNLYDTLSEILQPLGT